MKNNKLEKAIKISVITFFLFGCLGTLFSLIPDPKNPSWIIFIFVWLISAMFAICNLLDNGFQIFFTRIVKFISISILLLLLTIHTFLNSSWSMCFIASFIFLNIFIWIFPFVAPRLSKLIYNEVMTPKTKISRFISSLLVLLIGSGSVGGVVLARIVYHEFTLSVGLGFLGLATGIFGIVISYFLANQICQQINFHKINKSVNSLYSKINNHLDSSVILSDNKNANKFYKDSLSHFTQGKFEEAVSKLSDAIAIDPKFLEAYKFRGHIYSILGIYDKAINDFSCVINSIPDDPLMYYNRSVAFVCSEQVDQAINDINQAIKFDASNPDFYLHRCGIYIYKGDLNLAFQDADQTIKFGNHKDGYASRAITYEKKGLLIEATNDWTKVIKLDPRNATAYCMRGKLLNKLGNLDLAIMDLKKGLKIGKDLSDPIKTQSRELLDGLMEKNKKDFKVGE